MKAACLLYPHEQKTSFCFSEIVDRRFTIKVKFKWKWNLNLNGSESKVQFHDDGLTPEINPCVTYSISYYPQKLSDECKYKIVNHEIKRFKNEHLTGSDSDYNSQDESVINKN